MGFLSGVLGAVKDENEVTTYDKDKSKDINKVINTLKDNIGFGRAGLVVSVGAVKEWLEGYGNKLQEKTSHVLHDLGKLHDDISGIYITNINAGDNLQTQLTRWQSTVNDIHEYLSNTEAQYVNKLDSVLQNSIMCEIKSLQVTVAHLISVAKMRVFTGHAALIDEKLLNYRSKIRDTTQTGFERIRYGVTCLEEAKTEQINVMKKAVNDAKEEMFRWNQTSDAQIQYKLNDIKARLTQVDPGNQHAGGEGINSKLRLDVKEVKTQIGNIKSAMQEYVRNLHGWMRDTNNCLNNVRKKQVAKIMDNGVGWQKEAHITQQVEALKHKGEEVYWTFKNANERVTTLVAKAKEELEVLEGHIKKELKTVKTGIKTEMKNYFEGYVKAVQKEVEKIKNGDNGTDRGLQGIVDGVVKDYVSRYQNFENIVDGWLKDILEDQHNKSLVKKYISAYVTDSRTIHSKLQSPYDGKGKVIDQMLTQRVKDAIIQALKTVSTGIQLPSFKKPKEEDVSSHVKAVQTVCNDFGMTLESKIDDKENEFVCGIAKAIATSLGAVDPQYRDCANSNLISAVYLILHRLIAKANQTKKDLHSFVIDRKLSENVHGALGTTANLNTNLELVITSEPSQAISATNYIPGSTGPKTVKLTDHVEKSIDTILEKTLSDDSNVKVSSSAEVDITKLGEYEQEKGRVIGAIGNIVTDGFEMFNKHISNIYVKNAGQNGTGEMQILYTDITQNLTQLIAEFAKIGNDVNEELKNLQKYSIDDQLNEIKVTIDDFQATHVPAVLNAVDYILTKIEDLEAAPSFVEEQKQEIGQLMRTLNNKIDSKLNDIYQLLEIVDGALIAVIRDIRTAMSNAHENIQTIITEAFQTLTSEIRSLSANEKAADLRALQNLLNGQLKNTQEIIRVDMITGIKGILRALNGEVKDKVYKKGNPQGVPNLLDSVNNALKSKSSLIKNDIFTLSDALSPYLDKVLLYVKYQLRGPEKPSEKSELVEQVKQKLDALLNHLQYVSDDRKYLYDHQFTQLLTTLSTSLAALTPSAFANPRHPELLDAVKKGLEGFVGEMGKVYVNKYQGHKGPINMNRLVVSTLNSDGKSGSEEQLTDDGRKLSKICLTVLSIINDNVSRLKKECSEGAKNEWHNKQIYLYEAERNGKRNANPLGHFLKRCGYDVAENSTSKDGELQHKIEWNGEKVLSKLDEDIESTKSVPHLTSCSSTNKVCKLQDVLECLLKHLAEYYNACHFKHIPSPRSPCNIYEMLCWFTGLPYNAVYVPLQEYCEKLYRHEGYYDVQRQLEDAVGLDLPDVCKSVHDVLTTIIGTGDAETVYAVDFTNNYHNLLYPSDPSQCLDMLLDIMRRLFAVLRFLYTQCSLKSKDNGWSQCQYGKKIPTTKSPCGRQLTEETTRQPNDEVKCKPDCQAKCEPNCQPTSPLMSYLNDCLPGHLPHFLESVGCKAECKTCSKSSSGMPCLTPLGFRAFSGSTKTGNEICDVLSKLFKIRNIRILFCLVPKTPSTLPEHFGFALSFVKEWKSTGKHILKDYMKSTVKKVSIDLYTEPSKLTDALMDAYGSEYVEHHGCKGSHLRNLTTSVSCKSVTDKDIDCAPYLSTLCHDSYCYLTTKHSNLYLSWAVYLPWDFWYLLKNFYDAFCGIACQDWGCSSCLRGDGCRKGSHGVIDDEKPNNICKCTTIVDCNGVSPTLHQHGFVFGDPSALRNTNYVITCADFCKQLSNVLKSQYFNDLFAECDNLLYYIRFPFMTLTLALWLLSLFYLLHIMVVRLDLLHIKSHLHSPSSHRIAAQSLLAAARVNKLNRVFYLQP